MKHAKRILEQEIKSIENYKKNGGIKDVENLLSELKKELKTIIAKEEPKQGSMSEAIKQVIELKLEGKKLEEIFNIIDDEKCRYSTEEAEFWHHYKIGVLDGLNWKQEKKYSEKFNKYE